MNSLWVVRLFTVVLALAYGLAYAPDAWRYLLHPNPHLEAMSPHQPYAIVRAGVIGVYVTVLASVVLVVGILPRWRAGVSALSWCFLLMALSLLNHWAVVAGIPYRSHLAQLSAFAWTFVFTLPPLLIAVFVRLPAVQQSLYAQGENHPNA